MSDNPHGITEDDIQKSSRKRSVYRADTLGLILGVSIIILGVSTIFNKCGDAALYDKVRVLENKVERLDRSCVTKDDLVKKRHAAKATHP